MTDIRQRVQRILNKLEEVRGRDGRISAQPLKKAIEARRRANQSTSDDHSHSVANPARGEPTGERGLPNHGYQRGRKIARRQRKNR